MDSRLRFHELGFLELSDKPSQEELVNYYASKYYQNELANYRKKYSDLEAEVITQRVDQRAQKVFSICGNIKGKLLDIGCGEGFVLSYFLKLGWEVTGIDFSKAGVEQMNPDCLEYLEQGDVFELLDQKINLDKNYDVVWLGNVIEHVLDPLALLNSLKKIVHEKSIVIAIVPNDGNAYHEFLYDNKLIPSRWWVAIPDHISYFTADSLKQTVEATGWECIALHADFPVDWFLANESSNFLTDKSRGPFAHDARLRLEYLIGQSGPEKANKFYESLAGVGLGRNIIAYLRLMT